MEEETLLGQEQNDVLEENDAINIYSDESLIKTSTNIDEGIKEFSSGYNNLTSSEKSVIELEVRKKYFMNPEVQANILLENYIRSSKYVIDGKTKRKLKREFLRNAQKGRYRKLFNEQIYGISKEDSIKNFQKLNG